MSRSHAFTAAALLVAALVGLVRLGGRQAAPAATPPPAIRVERQAEARVVFVHVAGAVRRPGVYRMRSGARVDDAVREAGGATRRGDLSAVNLAAVVEDGRQVLVPERARRGTPAAVGGTAAAPSGPLNLNTATIEQLDTLDGIGPGTAQKIVDFREANGGFGSVEELGQVPGIGEKRMAGLREAVTV